MRHNEPLCLGSNCVLVKAKFLGYSQGHFRMQTHLRTAATVTLWPCFCPKGLLAWLRAAAESWHSSSSRNKGIGRILP